MFSHLVHLTAADNVFRVDCYPRLVLCQLYPTNGPVSSCMDKCIRLPINYSLVWRSTRICIAPLSRNQIELLSAFNFLSSMLLMFTCSLVSPFWVWMVRYMTTIWLVSMNCSHGSLAGTCVLSLSIQVPDICWQVWYEVWTTLASAVLKADKYMDLRF